MWLFKVSVIVHLTKILLLKSIGRFIIVLLILNGLLDDPPTCKLQPEFGNGIILYYPVYVSKKPLIGSLEGVWQWERGWDGNITDVFSPVTISHQERKWLFRVWCLLSNVLDCIVHKAWFMVDQERLCSRVRSPERTYSSAEHNNSESSFSSTCGKPILSSRTSPLGISSTLSSDSCSLLTSGYSGVSDSSSFSAIFGIPGTMEWPKE